MILLDLFFKMGLGFLLGLITAIVLGRKSLVELIETVNSMRGGILFEVRQEVRSAEASIKHALTDAQKRTVAAIDTGNTTLVSGVVVETRTPTTKRTPKPTKK